MDHGTYQQRTPLPTSFHESLPTSFASGPAPSAEHSPQQKSSPNSATQHGVGNSPAKKKFIWVDTTGPTNKRKRNSQELVTVDKNSPEYEEKKIKNKKAAKKYRRNQKEKIEDLKKEQKKKKKENQELKAQNRVLVAENSLFRSEISFLNTSLTTFFSSLNNP
eukprot:CAMPEP_0174263624 /NCGR_PEP_ID=MMETSP0439-20130205/19376_1 /TAXON_ID=0 /ORGANISM="Stereomyxa ramosa, Strain Chinc5" /LENGTH=162 /DNA_ID=CAMNT_0015349063 /DNA_START=72 /DNA_END=560 /DNA_ORIENTATION=+